MYGSENWAMNRSEGSGFETAEMRFLRRLYEYTLTDHVRNTTIRTAYDLEERIQDYRNTWHNHILRMNSS
jgi:hypothetical protein